MESLKMKCPQCRFENRKGAKFCNECGHKFDLTCPKCHASNRVSSKFCDECGYDLRRPEDVPTIHHREAPSYTPKFLAEKILTTRSSIEGERKLVTVLFADVANYTAIAEMLDPEEVHEIIDGCFKILMNEIHRYEGTINQFTGDGIMAIFGAPVAHEDHAQRACYASLAIQKALGDYAGRLVKEYNIEFKMRIGLNSGPVVVGAIGDDLRMDYTAVGDTTNLAARMEREARPGSIFISKNTHLIAKDYFEFLPLGKMEIKGKKKPQEAYELIRAGDEKTRLKALAARGLTKFAGRKNSMAALKDPFERVLTGSGQVVGIAGEAGVGKSRLLLEFINQLPQEKFICLEGRCLRYGESILYMPILEILRSYFDIKEDDNDDIINRKINEQTNALDEKLVNCIAPIQELLTQSTEDESYLALDPRQKREKTFESLRELFITESRNKPLMLVFEDVHWIDKTSEEYLDYLIGAIANSHIMLVILYRSEYTHPWASKSYYTKIGLTQLRPASSNQMVTALLKKGKAATELKQLILNRSSGNPLFMEEITNSLLESGSIHKFGRQLVLNTKASDIHLPDTIQGIIAARLDRLDDRLKYTMQVASVIGREFTFRILQALTGTHDEIKSCLHHLQGLELIYEKSLFPDLEYTFKHALTQEVAYNSLLQKRRKEIHRKIALAIEALFADRLETLFEIMAYHYSKSGELVKAYQYLKLSGEKATKKFSNWEAFQFYKTACSMLDKMKDSPETKKKKLKILHLMAIPMQLLGYPDNSLDFLKLGEMLSEELGDKKHLSLFLGSIGSFHSVRGGDPLLGIKYSEKSFHEAEKIEGLDIMAPVASRLCAFYIIAGEPYKTSLLALKVMKVIKRQNRQHHFFGLGNNVYTALSLYYGHSLGWLGDFEKGELHCKKGLEFGKKIDSLTGLALAEFLYGYLYMHKGDGKNVKKHFRECIKYCEEGGALIWLGLAWTGLGMGHFFISDKETALKYINKGMKIQKDAGIPYYLSFHHFALGMVQAASGNVRQSEQSFKAALGLSYNHNEKWIEGTSRIYLGITMAHNDESKIETAEKSILEGIKILDDRKIKPWSSIGCYNLGMFHADCGKMGPARIHLNNAEKMFREMGMNYWLALTRQAQAFCNG
jgi:class 3 adenylate cyclase/tetratricopeptide (TPR) repeat protein